LQSCICQVGHFSQKHVEIDRNRGGSWQPLREQDAMNGQALNPVRPLEPVTGSQH